MSSSTGEKESSFRALITKLKKRHIIETFAGSIAGGWLFLQFVDRILITHYHINEKWLDVTFFTMLGTLLCVILWRWFSGTEKRRGKVKVEVLIVPLVILITLAIDLNLILQMADIPGRTLMIGIIAFLLGMAWVIFKSLQWAVGTPEARFEKFDTSRLADIKPEKSIVVLPFKNISPEEGQDYFSEGLTEELITMLSKVLSLRVISRTSAFMFKDTPKSVGMIAQELNVGYVLEGSVRKAGNKLRISAQLIDAAADAHIWADNYDGNLDYVFDIQENVARAIVDKLQLKLTAPEERQIAKRPIADRQAHDFYLRARDAMYRTLTAESIDEAIRFLEAGLGIAGDNALLLATLANVYLQAVRVWIKEEADLVKAEEYAQKALRLDPGMAPAHIALGYIQWLRGNPRESFRSVKQALWLDPNDIDTVVWAFWLFITAGKTPTALDVAKHIAELDPVHPFLFFYPSVIHAYEGRFDTAIDELKRLIPPVFLEQPDNLGWLGWWLLLAGRLDEAKAALEPYEKVAGPGLQLWLPRILWLALSGQRHRLDEETSGKSGERAKHDSLISSIVADLYVMLGDHQKAVTWLETAVDHGFINYPYISRYDPMLARLRNEPPFQKLMERVKYEWEHFEE